MLNANANRTVSVADRRYTGTGVVEQFDFVPAGATNFIVDITGSWL